MWIKDYFINKTFLSLTASQVFGVLSLGSSVLCPWFWVPSPWSQVLDPKSWVPSPGILGFGVLGPRSWIPDPGSRVLGSRYRRSNSPRSQISCVRTWALGPHFRLGRFKHIRIRIGLSDLHCIILNGQIFI